jgi:HK97 family phage portal protein
MLGLPAVRRVLDAFAQPFRAPVARSDVPATTPAPPAGYILPLGGGYIPASWPVNFWQMGYDPLSHDASSVVYGCIAAYAQTVAMCPPAHWRSTGDGGREMVTTSALSRILRKPNFYQSPSDFFLYLTDCLYRQGEAFGLALRNERFEINQIHLMNPRLCFARVAVTGDLFYTLGGNEIVERMFEGERYLLDAVPARDVLHVRLPDPRNPLKGCPPLEASLIERAASEAMVQQALAYANNQGRPSGVLSTEADLNEEQVTFLRMLWDKQTKGVNQGGTPILTNGLKWESAVMNSRDAQIAEFLKLSDARIATAYRVPQALLSLEPQGPQTSTEALMQYWVATGLGFAANHIEEAFGLLFGLAGQPIEYMEMDFEALLRANFRDRMEGLARAVQGGIFAPNEARAREELPKKPYGDEPRVQQQVVPLSAWAQTPPATPAPDAPPSSPPAGDEPNVDGSTQEQFDWVRAINDAADRYRAA